jgi:glycosyltransferase involved in cell wall biosynthesis
VIVNPPDSKKILVVYGAPLSGATSIRIKNLTSRLESVSVCEISIKQWPKTKVMKVILLLKNILRVLLLSKKDIWVYATPGLAASAIPAVVCKWLRPSVNVIADWDDSFENVLIIKPPIWKASFWEKKLIQSASKVIVVSDKLNEICLDLGKMPTDICYVSNGVDLKTFDPNKERPPKPNPSEIVFGYVGSIAAFGAGRFVGKEIVDCAKKLKERGAIDNIHFLIVGDGTGFKLLDTYIKQQDLSKYFELVGFVSHEKIPSIMSRMDAGIVPLDISLFTAYTRSSCKIKEFVAMNKTVITTSAPENEKDLKSGELGILVKCDDDLIEGIDTYLSNIDHYKSLDLRSYAERFNFDILSKRLSAFILN